MKTLICFGVMMLFLESILSGQISFDYSAVELIVGGNKNTEEIINNAGYQHILAHSRKYSSDPLTENNLQNSLNGRDEGFDFSNVGERKEKYLKIIDFLKSHEQEIVNCYARLCLRYLPDDYEQKAIIFYVIGGYNGIAFDNKICMNIDFEQFRKRV